MLDVTALSVLFCLDCSCNSPSPVISIVWKSALKLHQDQFDEHSKVKNIDDLVDEVVFILTKNAKIHVIDGRTGDKINSNPPQLRKKSIPLSMYVVGKWRFIYITLSS